MLKQFRGASVLGSSVVSVAGSSLAVSQKRAHGRAGGAWEGLEARRMLSAAAVFNDAAETLPSRQATVAEVRAIVSQTQLIPLTGSSLTGGSLAGGSLAGTPFKALDKLPAATAKAKLAAAASAAVPFKVNLGALKKQLKAAPLEFTPQAASAPLEIALPSPDGTLARFAVWESPIMEEGLARKFANIKTYGGVGLDDPTQTIRFDVTPAGLHASVRGGEGGGWYIDPQYVASTAAFISYNRADMLRTAVGEIAEADHDHADHDLSGDVHLGDLTGGNLTGDEWATELGEDQGWALPGLLEDEGGGGGGEDASTALFGSTLRTFRLAVAATGEYTAFFGGTVAAGQAAIVTAINRVNQIYESEINVRLVLVANNSSLVFTNRNTDPYTNNDGFAMLDQNQATVDSIIGPANYDIGHVFSTGGGGVAGFGVVGFNGFKAQGVTGQPAPTGDGFWVDYVAHEMGHQFRADHTFNGTQGSAAGNQNSSTAYEPGSGTSIMGSAGICGNDDLAAHSDPYFHMASLQQIRNFLTGIIPSVGTSTAVANSAPTVSAGGTSTTAVTYVIPASTPFALTATATDAEGEPITYDWQEFNLGSLTPLSTADQGTIPLNRQRPPSSSPTRIVPNLATVLAGQLFEETPKGKSSGSTFYSERVPTANRNVYRWRVVARDNHAGGGGVSYDQITLRVTNTGSGGFAMTSQNSSTTWTTGSTQTVTWNVAGTNANGINVANVRITMSTDGGNTFPYVIADSTPNDGSQEISVPFIPASTTTARIKIEAIGNIFFDINNANLTVNSGIAPPAAPGTPILAAVSDSGISDSDRITNFNNATPDKALTFLVPNTVAGTTVIIKNGNTVLGSAVATGSLTTVITSGNQTVTDGTTGFTAAAVNAGGTSVASGTTTLTIDTVAPATPVAVLAAVSDTGVSASDGITADNTPTVGAVAEPGATTVSFQLDGVEVDSGAPANGIYVYTSGPIADGAHQFTATTSDVAGNTSAPSAPVNLTIDTVAPAVSGGSLAGGTVRNGGLAGSETITFTESVFGLEAAGLSLTRDGAAVSLSGAGVSGAGSAYTLAGLSEETAATGTYALALGNVTDLAGNSLEAGVSFSNNVIDLAAAGTSSVTVRTSDSDPAAVSIFLGGSPTASHVWTFSPGQDLRIDGTAGNEVVRYEGLAASPNVDVVLALGGGNDRLDVASGTFAATSDLGAGVAVNVFSNAKVRFNAGQSIRGIELAAGAVAELHADVVVSGAVNIAHDGAPIGSRSYTAFLDVRDRKLVARNGDLAGLADAARYWQRSGPNGGKGTSGLGSSLAAGTPFATVAVAGNNVGGNPRLTSFAGTGVGANDVLIRYTYLGDLDLDGDVDSADFGLFSAGGSGWIAGDINRSGLVDAFDFQTMLEASRAGLTPLA